MRHTLLCVVLVAMLVALVAAWGPAVHRACVLAVLGDGDDKDDETRTQVLLASTFADACKGVLPAVHDLRHLTCAALSAATPAEHRVARALALHVVADTLGDRAYLRGHAPLHADEVLADAMLLWHRVSPLPNASSSNSSPLAVPARDGTAYTAFARTVAALLDRAARTCTNSSAGSGSSVTAATAERAARWFEALVRADVLSAQLHHSGGAVVALHRARGGLADLAPTLACVRAAGTHWLRALDAASASADNDPMRAADAVVAATAAEIARLVGSGACAGTRAGLPAAVAVGAVVLAAAAWGVVAVAVVLRPC